MFATVGLFQGHENALVIATIAPLVAAPSRARHARAAAARQADRASCACSSAASAARRAMLQVRSGLEVFRHPKLGAWAAFTQLTAWAIQWFACYVLLVALGLDEQAGLGAAAAVLFAVNVTAALPATPSNLGRLPGRLRGRAVRLRREPHRRVRLRDHPAGGRDRDRGDDGDAGAACARACPGRTCACGRFTRRRSSCADRATAARPRSSRRSASKKP